MPRALALVLALAALGCVSPGRSAARPTFDERLLFHPTKHPDGSWQPAGLAFEDVWLTAADGTGLHAWHVPHPRPRAAALVLHGNAGHLAHRAPELRRLHALGIETLIVDYRGFGRSAGTPTVAGAVLDAQAARAELARRAGVPESRVVLIGTSLGGAIACQLAKELPPRGVVLHSTFSSLREVAGSHFPLLAWMVPKDKLDSVAALRHCPAPTLMTHGDADAVVPIALANKLFAAAAGPKTFIEVPGGTHNRCESPEADAALEKFLAELP